MTSTSGPEGPVGGQVDGVEEGTRDKVGQGQGSGETRAAGVCINPELTICIHLYRGAVSGTSNVHIGNEAAIKIEPVDRDIAVSASSGKGYWRWLVRELPSSLDDLSGVEEVVSAVKTDGLSGGDL